MSKSVNFNAISWSRNFEIGIIPGFKTINDFNKINITIENTIPCWFCTRDRRWPAISWGPRSPGRPGSPGRRPFLFWRTRARPRACGRRTSRWRDRRGTPRTASRPRWRRRARGRPTGRPLPCNQNHFQAVMKTGHCISWFVIIFPIVIAARLRLRDFILFMLRVENFETCGIFDKKRTIFEWKSLNRQKVYSIYEVFGELLK